MNTVEALNVLGKALCGDSFEVKPGLTDAETILEIAKYINAMGADWDLSDRLAKGVDSNGNVVVGAVIEGAIKDIEGGGPTPPPEK